MALICIVITALISGISLTGWVSGWLIITRISENFIPMAPSTALSFIFLSLALYIHIRYPEGHRIRVLAGCEVFIILLVCLIIFFKNVTDINIDVERFLLPSPQKFGNVSMGRMSPVTAGNFLLDGSSLFLLLAKHGVRRRTIAVVLAITAALVGLWVSLSYMYGTFVLYETAIIPVALNTSVGFMILSLGIIASAGASCWPVSSLTGSSVRARLLRTFLPITMAIVLVFGWLNAVVFLHSFDFALLTAMTTVLTIVIISFVVSKVAKAIGGAIDLAEAERRRAEEARRANEERYRSLFENMLNGFAYCRMLFEGDRPLDFIYLDVNFAFEKLTGLKNVVGKKVTEVIPGIREEDPGLFEIYGRVALTGKPEKFEIYVAALNSWFSISVYSPNREYFVAVFDVITERKKAEEELKIHREHLEELVKFRTLELEDVNRELEAFSYSVSHDLRAPLRHITGFAELLIKKAPAALDEKSRHYLGVISESAKHMGKLVDDLLSFSRMGRVEMLQLSINLEKIVSDAIESLRTETAGRHIEWKIGTLPKAYGDPVMLKVVFENLVSNAIKFTRLKPQTVIEIGCSSDRPDEQMFYVKDNGAGFDMKYADKLFGLFQRLHRSEEFEGTGLGLANVRRVIHRHGGRIWAEGAVNEGAAVYFSLTKPKEG